MMDKEALAYHRHMRKVAREAKAMIEPLTDADRLTAAEEVGADLLGENHRLKRELRQIKRLTEEVDQKATQEAEGEWVRAYVIPSGVWHRLLGIVRG